MTGIDDPLFENVDCIKYGTAVVGAGKFLLHVFSSQEFTIFNVTFGAPLPLLLTLCAQVDVGNKAYLEMPLWALLHVSNLSLSAALKKPKIASDLPWVSSYHFSNGVKIISCLPCQISVLNPFDRTFEGESVKIAVSGILRRPIK